MLFITLLLLRALCTCMRESCGTVCVCMNICNSYAYITFFSLYLYITIAIIYAYMYAAHFSCAVTQHPDMFFSLYYFLFLWKRKLNNKLVIHTLQCQQTKFIKLIGCYRINYSVHTSTELPARTSHPYTDILSQLQQCTQWFILRVACFSC